MANIERVFYIIQIPQYEVLYVACSQICTPMPREVPAARGERPIDEIGLVVPCPFVFEFLRSQFQKRYPCAHHTTWVKDDLENILIKLVDR